LKVHKAQPEQAHKAQLAHKVQPALKALLAHKALKVHKAQPEQAHKA
jgi:hypothetical protein